MTELNPGAYDAVFRVPARATRWRERACRRAFAFGLSIVGLLALASVRDSTSPAGPGSKATRKLALERASDESIHRQKLSTGEHVKAVSTLLLKGVLSMKAGEKATVLKVDRTTGVDRIITTDGRLGHFPDSDLVHDGSDHSNDIERRKEVEKRAAAAQAARRKDVQKEMSFRSPELSTTTCASGEIAGRLCECLVLGAGKKMDVVAEMSEVEKRHGVVLHLIKSGQCSVSECEAMSDEKLGDLCLPGVQPFAAQLAKHKPLNRKDEGLAVEEAIATAKEKAEEEKAAQIVKAEAVVEKAGVHRTRVVEAPGENSTEPSAHRDSVVIHAVKVAVSPPFTKAQSNDSTAEGSGSGITSNTHTNTDRGKASILTSEPEDCVTKGGTAPPGSRCHFPFEYGGQLYFKCTSVDALPPIPWCFTATNSDEWGECVCQTSSTSRPKARSSGSSSGNATYSPSSGVSGGNGGAAAVIDVPAVQPPTKQDTPLTPASENGEGTTVSGDAEIRNELNSPSSGVSGGNVSAATTISAPGATTDSLPPTKQDTTVIVKISVWLPIPVSEFNDAKRQLFRESMSRAAGVDVSQVIIIIQVNEQMTRHRSLLSEGVRINVEITVKGSGVAKSVASKLTSDNINAELDREGLPSAEVLSAAQEVLPASGENVNTGGQVAGGKTASTTPPSPVRKHVSENGDETKGSGGPGPPASENGDETQESGHSKGVGGGLGHKNTRTKTRTHTHTHAHPDTTTHTHKDGAVVVKPPVVVYRDRIVYVPGPERIIQVPVPIRVPVPGPERVVQVPVPAPPSPPTATTATPSKLIRYVDIKSGQAFYGPAKGGQRVLINPWENRYDDPFGFKDIAMIQLGKQRKEWDKFDSFIKHQKEIKPEGVLQANNRAEEMVKIRRQGLRDLGSLSPLIYHENHWRKKGYDYYDSITSTLISSPCYHDC